MSTNFPASLDALTNPTASDAMNSATVPHATQHTNANDAIEALQAKVGADNSTDPDSLDYKVAKAQSSYTITDGAAFEIDPANGSVQVVTLGASRTPAATNFEAGQTVLLGIDDGTAYSITWTTVNPTWVKAGGTASAPTLAATGYTWILLWKVGSVIYAGEVGKP